MTDLTPTPSFSPVPQLETTTLALAGPGQPMNSQAQALLNRTEYLKDQMDGLAEPDGDSKIGAGVRTQAGKNSDFFSVRDKIIGPIDGTTVNQAGIVDAVSEALAQGKALYWPAGTYVSDDNIPGFNSVSHFGPGVLKRGSDTFKFSQWGAQLNVFYVSNSGSDTNDGLSAAQPFLTIQAAGNAILQNWSENLLVGTWRIQLEAGTYRRATFGGSVRNAQRLQVFGPSVSWGIPTAVISNLDAETNAIGLYFNGLDRCHAKDIKFTGFNGSNGQGVTASQAGDFYCENVHADLCGWTGINMSPGGVLRVAGGKVTNCSEGIRAYSGVTFTIGYNSQANPTLIQNCTFAGFTAHNSSNGHVDYAEISNCAIAALMSNQSRIDFFGAKLMGNNVAISCDGLSTYIKNTTDAVLFNSGAANAITERCSGNSLPYEALSYFTYAPPTRVSRYGTGWSGASPNSAYKHVWELQTGDAGLAVLSPDGMSPAFTFGRVSNPIAGRLSYVHSADQWRIVANGANILFASATSFSSASDNVASNGTNLLRWSDTYSTRIRPGAGGVIWTSGTGTPEGVVTAPVGSLYTRTDGGAGTTQYTKESGTGNTGWVAK